jgi:NitT/TauT family transport system substrate-binding protein
MRRVFVIWAIAFVLSLMLLYAPEQKVDVRIGILTSVDTMQPYVAERMGYFNDEGLTYSIRVFGSSPLLGEALQSGDIDVAYMSLSPTATRIVKGAKIRVVSGASRGGDFVMARTADAKGSIAINQKGSMTDTVFLGYVKGKVKFEPRRGIEPADMPTALLLTKDVDAAMTWEPFATKIEDNGGVLLLDVGKEWEKDYGTKYQRNVLVASEKFVENKDALERVLRVHERTTEYLNKPESGALLDELAGTELHGRRMEFNSSLDWASMERIMRYAYEAGYIKRVPTKDEMIYNMSAN